ncbi:cytochrome oxidase c subunit VIb-domain-containing protein [Linnemannia elongata]|nr:cytochrome oxidase c subunit VIb-domain-containing protein [Linnemannia elongata]KAK5821552.1 cytochrome oxidase c subunit VIb-domain-containing protein [Linnemannia elongata]
MTSGNNDEVKHPSRADRQNCWKVRDAYFECLNNANIIDPSKPEAANVCQDLRSLYEKGCMKSWVDYFNKRKEAIRKHTSYTDMHTARRITY